MKQVETVDLNECWAFWLDKMYPGIHPALAMKDIIIKRLAQEANSHPEIPDDAHVGFFTKWSV